jgi:hypothetical protein
LDLKESGGMSDDPLDQELQKLDAQGPNMMKGLQDANIRPALILLVKAVRRLDVTSNKLARVNLFLTIVIVVLTVVQIVLTLFHH